MLSLLRSIFDPVGLIAPALIESKSIMQELRGKN